MAAFPSRVLVISDYGKSHFEERLSGGIDFVLSLGDVDYGILQEIFDIYLSPIFAVRGNRDTAADFPACVENVHRKVVTYRKWTIGGYQCVPRHEKTGILQWDDARAGFELSRFPAVDIFICHAPLFKITDKTDCAHVGSEAIRRYVEEKQPRIVYHGHVHSEIGAMVGDSAVVSVSGARLVTLS